MKRGLSFLAILGLLNVLPSEAGWYSEKFPKPGADLYMIDIQYPHFNEPTYFACWNINFTPKGGYFYGGCVGYLAPDGDKVAYSPGSVWTFWTHDCYENQQARNVYANPVVYGQQYGGEGSSGAAGSPRLPWVKIGQWYTMTLRIWGTDAEKKEAYVGQWQKDVKNNEWHHIGSFRIPYAADGIQSNSGFIEGTGGGQKPREVWRGKGYLRYGKDHWEKGNQIVIDVPKDNGSNYYGWKVTQPEDKSYMTMYYTADRQYEANLKTGEKYTFEINQPDTPTLDTLEATGNTQLLDDQLIVQWTIGKNSSPQLGYRIDVYDNPEKSGVPLKSQESLTPHRRSTSLSLPKAKGYYPKLTLIDIFDQEKEISLEKMKGEKITARKTKVQPGMNYTYVQKDGGWTSLAEVDFSQPTRTGNSHGLDIALRGDREGGIAFQFEGFLKVPKSAAYTFALTSSDGATVTLGGKELFHNDKIQGPSEIDNACFLEAGLVPIKVSYFKKDPAALHTVLWLGWSVDGQPLSEIPSESYVCDASQPVPKVQMQSKTLGTKQLLSVKSDIENIAKIDYFNSGKYVGTASAKPFTLSAPLFEGTNEFFARVMYNGNVTVDTEELNVEGKSSYPEGWTYSVIGEPNLPHGLQYKDGVYTYVGDGEYMITKPIKGDFELSAKVNAVKKDGILDRAWVGIMAKPHLKVDNFEAGIYSTARSGIRPCPNYSDLATTRVASYELPPENQYLKLTRHGPLIRAYSSPDGEKWTLAYERYQTQFPDELHAGLTFHSVPGKGNVIFSGEIQDLQLKPSAYTPEPINPSIPLGEVIGYSLLSEGHVVKQLKQGATLLTPQSDGTYQETKLNLPEGIINLRSVASDGKVMLILARKSEESGSVYRSEDQGKTWTEMLKDIPLDPDLGNQVAGSLLEMNEKVPGRCVVAAHKKGLYFSEDSGKTWRDPVLPDQAFMVIKYHPLFNDNLIVSSFDSEKKINRFFEVKEMGAQTDWKPELANVQVLNFFFCKRDAGVVNIATRNGYYHSYNMLQSFFRTLHTMNPDKVYLAGDTQNLNGTTNYWITTADGKHLYSSFYFGLNWEEHHDLPDWGNVFQIKQDEQNREHATFFTEKGVFKTEDRAKSWRQLL